MERSSTTHPMFVAAVAAGLGAVSYWALGLLLPQISPNGTGRLLAALFGLAIRFMVGFVVSRRVQESPIVWAGIAGLTMALFLFLIGSATNLALGVRTPRSESILGVVVGRLISIGFTATLVLLGGLFGAQDGSKEAK